MKTTNINVEGGGKCYFCGRGKKQIEPIFKEMEKKMEKDISSIETEIKNLDNEFKKKEESIRNDMKDIDLSYKISTLGSDRERFEKEIPHFSLWIGNLMHEIRQEYQERKKNKMDLTTLPTERIMNPNRYSNKDTIKDIMDLLGTYMSIMKDKGKLELENELLDANIIKESYEEHDLRPLVTMKSKPLGKVTDKWKSFAAKGGTTGSGKIKLPAVMDVHGRIVSRERDMHEPTKYETAQRFQKREDNVAFVLTLCHFCYDRFQGSTL